MKYLLMGAIASAVILYGMAYLFGLTGTTRLVAPDGEISIATVIAERGDDMRAGLLLASVMLIAGLGFKMAVVPFQMWVPDVYEGAPAPVAAFLSVASKAAAFAVVLRIFFEGLPDAVISDTGPLIFAIVAAVSMTVGNLFALVQIEHQAPARLQLDRAGRLLHGRSRGGRPPPTALSVGASGVLFFLGAYALTNLGAFIVVIAISRPHRQRRDRRLRGPGQALAAAGGGAGLRARLADRHPADGGLRRQDLHLQRRRRRPTSIWLVVIAVLNSVVSAFYYLRVAGMMFTGEPARPKSLPTSMALKLALIVAVAGIIFVGVVRSPLLDAAADAAAVFVQ